MAFLGSFGKEVGRVFNNPVVQVLFPVAAVANIGGLALGSKISNAFGGGGGKTSQSQAPAPAQYVINPGNQQQQYYPQYYSQPSGSYLDQYQPSPYDYGGGQSWGYSTSQPTYLVTAPAASSATSSVPWEDLVGLGVGLFL